jgi:hypothetical protein
MDWMEFRMYREKVRFEVERSASQSPCYYRLPTTREEQACGRRGDNIHSIPRRSSSHERKTPKNLM